MVFKGRCQRDMTCIKDNGHAGEHEYSKWPTPEELDKLKNAPVVASTKQVGGDHYKMSLQPIDVIDAWGLDFYEGSALKYLARHRKKNGAEDLKKAIHYLELLLERQYPSEQA